ncbi:MAG: hypothetical protein KDJ38_12630 [Gammaproteobacteria bacterium]|nr:hypothetical protein [Gammaproteobacteria bacterium]
MNLKNTLCRHTSALKLAAMALSILLLQACAGNAPRKPASLSASIMSPFQNLDPGYSFLQEINGSGLTRNIVWVYKGEEDGLYRWDLFRDSNTDGDPWQTQWFNEHGAMVRYEQSLSTATWSPHNCFRVIGECEFQYTDPYGFENAYVREGSFDGRTWSYKLYRLNEDNRHLISNGDVRFNQAGIEVFHESYMDNNGHQIARVTRFF